MYIIWGPKTSFSKGDCSLSHLLSSSKLVQRREAHQGHRKTTLRTCVYMWILVAQG